MEILRRLVQEHDQLLERIDALEGALTNRQPVLFGNEEKTIPSALLSDVEMRHREHADHEEMGLFALVSRSRIEAKRLSAARRGHEGERRAMEECAELLQIAVGNHPDTPDATARSVGAITAGLRRSVERGRDALIEIDRSLAANSRTPLGSHVPPTSRDDGE